MPDWVYSATSAVLLGAAAALLYWSLFHDRARGRRRCPRCWYDMSGAHADGQGRFTCPECGTIAAGPRALARTRRRWWAAGVGAAMLIGADAAVVPLRPDDGWTRIVPTTLAILFADFGDRDGDVGPMLGALLDRDSDGALWGWQRWIALRRDSSLLTGADVRRSLVTRPQWPRGEPILLRLEPPESMVPLMGDRSIRVFGEDASRPLLALDYTDSLGYITEGPARRKEGVLPAAPVGEQEAILSFEYHLDSDRGPLLRRDRVRLRMRIVDEPILRPVDNTEVASMLASSVAVYWAGTIEFRLSPSALEFMTARLSGAAIGIEAQVRDGDAVLSTYRGLLTGPSDRPNRLPPMRTWDVAMWSEQDTDAMRALLDSMGARRGIPRDLLERCTVHIRGDPSASLRDFAAETYWSGELTIPLRNVYQPPTPGSA